MPEVLPSDRLYTLLFNVFSIDFAHKYAYGNGVNMKQLHKQIVVTHSHYKKLAVMY